MQHLLKIILIAMFALSAIGRVLLIGEERKPVSKGEAAVNVVLDAALIWLIALYL